MNRELTELRLVEQLEARRPLAADLVPAEVSVHRDVVSELMKGSRLEVSAQNNGIGLSFSGMNGGKAWLEETSEPVSLNGTGSAWMRLPEAHGTYTLVVADANGRHLGFATITSDEGGIRVGEVQSMADMMAAHLPFDQKTTTGHSVAESDPIAIERAHPISDIHEISMPFVMAAHRHSPEARKTPKNTDDLAPLDFERIPKGKGYYDLSKIHRPSAGGQREGQAEANEETEEVSADAGIALASIVEEFDDVDVPPEVVENVAAIMAEKNPLEREKEDASVSEHYGWVTPVAYVAAATVVTTAAYRLFKDRSKENASRKPREPNAHEAWLDDRERRGH